MQTRFLVYDRLGAERGQLPNPLEAVWVPPLNKVPTLTIHYSLIDVRSDLLLDNPEIAFEYFDPNIESWVEPLNGRFKFFEEDFDHLEETPTKRYTFLGIGEGLKGATVFDRYGRDLTYGGRVDFPNANAGSIIKFIWDNAEMRGWGGFDYDFTATHDSAGQPWAQIFNISYEKKSDLAHILDSLVRQGACDYAWEGRTLHLYNAHTELARDLSLGDAPILFNLAGGPASVDGAPEMINTENLATHVIVEGENNLRWIYETGAILPEGRREVVLEYTGVNDEATARILAEPVILKSRSPLMNTTRQFHINPETKILPLHHYRIGDWCLVEREQQYQRMQIISMSLWVNQNGVHGYVTLGDNIDDALEKMYQAIQGLTGGIANEGVGAPPVSRNQAPSVPTSLLVTAEAYPGIGGEPQGLLGISLTHNFLDVHGDPINLDHFEIQYREVVTLPETRTWHVGARIYAPNMAGTISGVDIYDVAGGIRTYQVRAFAVSVDSVRSASSAVMEISMVEDSVPPPVPSTPTAQAGGATFTITSDGLGSVGEKMPRDYETSHVEMGTSAQGPWESVGVITGRGSLTIPATPLPSNGILTRWFRMYSIDTTGNASEPSGVAQATTAPLVPQSVFDEAVNELNTDIGSNVDEIILVRDAANEALTDAEQALEDAIADRAEAVRLAEEAERLAKEAAALDATTKANTAKSEALSEAAQAAQAEYDRLEALANAAEDQALEAAGLAADKGKVWPQPSAPPSGATYSWEGAEGNSVSLSGSRRNLVTNPAFYNNLTDWNTDISGWLVSGLRVPVPPEHSAFFGVPYAWESSWATGGVNGGYISVGSWPALAVDTPFHTEIKAATTQGSVPMRILLETYSPTAWLGDIISDTVTVSSGNTHQFVLDGVLPAGTTRVVIAMYREGAATSNDKMLFSAALFELGTSGSYFDGNFPDDRTNDLWIDTDGGNTPHRWDPINHVWIASTDQHVIDAATAAANSESAAQAAAGNAQTAQNAATEAQSAAADSATAANNAQSAANQAATNAEDSRLAAEAAVTDATNAKNAAEAAADQAEASRLAAEAAQRTANGKTTISPNAPTGADLAGKPAGSMWTQVVSGKVVGAWYKALEGSTQWLPLPFDPVMIPQINIGTGTFGELDGVRLKAKTIGVRELVVSDFENYATGGNFDYPEDLSLSWDYDESRIRYTTATKYSGVGSIEVSPGVSSLVLKEPIPTTEGEEFRVSFRVKMSADWNGTTEGSYFLFRDNQDRLSSIITLGPISTSSWAERTVDLSFALGRTLITPEIHFNHTAGTVWIDQMKVRRLREGSLLIDGSVKAAAIDTNDLTADTGFIDYLEARLVRSDLFIGKAFEGGTFTGSTFQTQLENLRGVKLTPGGLVGYSPSGGVVFSLASSTGNVRMVGRVATGALGTAGTTLLPAEESANGITSGMFISRDGALTGTVTAGVWVPDATTTSAQNLFLRGHQGGHVEIENGHLYVRGSRNRVGNFLNWAVGDGDPTTKYADNYLPGLRVLGNFAINGVVTTSQAANAHFSVGAGDENGRMYRSTSSIRYKADVQDYPADMRALSLRPRTWVDRNPIDPADPFHRYIGYIAEEVIEVMPEVVTLNEFGEPEAVSYERMPSPATVSILKELDRRLKAGGL